MSAITPTTPTILKNTKLTLYYDDVSPPVRSCLMLIKMLNFDVELKYVDLFKGEQMKAEFLALNPVHTVPVLVDDDLILTDSHVILMHLCEKYGNSETGEQLFPKEYTTRIKVINKLFFECGILFRRDSEFLSEIVRKGYENIDSALHDRKLNEALQVLETFLKQQKFMAGDHLTIADVSILTTLSTVNLIFPIATGANDKWCSLYDWFERMRALPEYEINQKGLDKLRKVIERLGKFEFPKQPKDIQPQPKNES